MLLQLLLACGPSKNGPGTDDTGGDTGDLGAVVSTTGPEHCGEVSSDEVWAADMVHVITCDVMVEGASLIIGPGTEVQVESNAGLYISYGGSAASLVVDGRASAPVRFHGAENANEGAWAGIGIYSSAAGQTLSMQHVSIEDAGGYGLPAALNVEDVELFVDSVSILNSEDAGFRLTEDGAGFAEGSTTLVVQDSALAGQVNAAGAGSVPTDGSYDGNEDNFVQIESGSITEDLTLGALDVPWWATKDLHVAGATLTIEAGATLAFSNNKGLYVAYSGETSGLVVNGSPSSPVLFKGAESGGAGAWSGVAIYEAADQLKLSSVEIRDAGGYGLTAGLVARGVEADITNLLVTDSEEFGFDFDEGASFILSSSSIEVTGCAQAGSIDASQAHTVPEAGAALTGNVDDSVQVTSSVLDTQVSWGDLGVPYEVSSDLYIQDGGLLSVEAGADLVFNNNKGLYVSYDGSSGGLKVLGTASDPVVFSAAESGSPGAWSGVAIYEAAEEADLSLAYLTIELAGGYGLDSGLRVKGSDVLADHLTILQSEEYGIGFSDNAEFADGSSDIVLLDNAWSGYIGADAVHSFPEDGAQLDDNDTDALRISGATLSSSASWGDLGVPYWVAGNVFVEGTNADPAVLTLEPGVELAFGNNKGLYISYSGGAAGLMAVGSSANPIAFYGAESGSKGAWSGIGIYNSSVDASCSFDYIEIGRAGGYGLKGNLHLSSSNPTVKNAYIYDSEEWGIYKTGGASPTLSAISYSGNASGNVN
jgi:hypothetical protein